MPLVDCLPPAPLQAAEVGRMSIMMTIEFASNFGESIAYGWQWVKSEDRIDRLAMPAAAFGARWRWGRASSPVLR